MKLTASQVAAKIGKSVYTIKRWYKWYESLQEEELNMAAKLIEDTLINVSEISSSVIQKVEESIENVLPKKNTYRPVYSVFALIRDELGIF